MNKSKFVLFFALVVLVVASTSCVTPKKVRYLQDMPREGMPLNDELEATLAPYDELRIHVYSNTGKDDELISRSMSMVRLWVQMLVMVADFLWISMATFSILYWVNCMWQV